MLFGTGSFTPSITAHQLLRDGTPVAHCVFDETTYTHPDSAQQSLGRAILNSRDAVVILPRDPLSPGSRYTVSITVNGGSYTWSFFVAAGASATAIVPEAQVR
jgi:hypothetical protein